MQQRKARPWHRARWIVLTLISVAAVLAFALSARVSLASTPPNFTSVSETRQVQQNAKPLGHVMRVGLQVKNIYELTLSSQSFMADGWYWLSWGDEVQTLLDKFRIPPSQIIEFANEIDPANYSFSQVLEEPLRISPELTHSYYVKFSKKFFLNEIAQKYAPFDRQRLPIDIEIMPHALSDNQPDNLVELLPFPIQQFPIAGEFASMIGFRLTNTGWLRQLVYYGEPNKASYSRATAIFTFSPQTWTVFLKWLLPLIVVMTIVVLVPSIDAILGDSRIAIAPAALLTLVILHDNYRSNFPPAPYLTFLDEIYAYSYLACLAIFLITLAGSNALCRLQAEDKEAWSQRINRWDQVAQLSIIVGFIIVTIVAWYD